MNPRLNRVAAPREARASMRGIIGFALVTLVAFVPAEGARAAGAAICNAYAREAAAKAQGVRDLACGYDMKDPRWTTDRKSHASWCRVNPDKTVAAEQAQRRGDINICSECRAYADFAVKSAAENDKLKCGFSGPRWNATAADHFGWCMALRGGESAAGPDFATSYKTIFAKIETSTHSETLERIEQIAACKSPAPK